MLVEALRRGWAESVGGAVPASIGASAQIAEVVDICATMAKRRWKPGAPIAVLGPHVRFLAAALERNGCTGVTREISASPHAVTVWVDLLDTFAGTWSERVEAPATSCARRRMPRPPWCSGSVSTATTCGACAP